MIDLAERILVFENFFSDLNLPKFKKQSFDSKTKYSVMSEDEVGSEEDFGEPKTPIYVTNFQSTVAMDSNMIVVRSNSVALPQSWFARVFWRIVSMFTDDVKPVRRVEQQTERMSVEEFFSSVRNSAKELEIVTTRSEGYGKALSRAKQAGQQALFEQLTAGLNAYKMETQLLALGLSRYLEEKDLVAFYKQSKRGLRLDWVRNFVRQIPKEVLDKKVRADEIGIFDNYVVLHYDPEAKSFAETEAEKAARKDPILFGLMEGRRRLYHVGDWKDEFCDLTLDQIADAMGDEVVKDLATETLVEVMEP